MVELPAVALLLKEKTPRWPVLLVAATNFCVNPELFVIPTPEISKVKLGLAVIVKALALALKTIPLTSVIAEREIAVWLLVLNVAVSEAPLGTVAGVQLVEVFQFPLPGFEFHAALPA